MKEYEKEDVLDQKSIICNSKTIIGLREESGKDIRIMKKLCVVMYHYTRDLLHTRYPAIKGLDYHLFEQQLQFFIKNFHVITMEEVLQAIDNKKAIPDNAVLLTFDDGYIDNFTVAFPLLQKYKIQGSFFIPGKTFTENVVLDVNKIHFILASASIGMIKKDLQELLNQYREEDFTIPSNKSLYEQYAVKSRFDDADTIFVKRVLQTGIPENIRSAIAGRLFKKYVGLSESDFSRELYMNRDQIRCMKENGMFIGLHGYDHYWMGKLPLEQMKKDVEKALEVMDEFIDRKAWVMNYPYGDFNEDVMRHIAACGCKLGLTTEVRIADLDSDSPYQIPRLDCNDFPPKSERYQEVGL